MIKFRYVYSNTKEIKTFVYSIEEIENNSVYEETTGFSRDFKLISRDRFTGLKDKNGVEIFERMEIDNKFKILHVAGEYILHNISNDDIISLTKYMEQQNDRIEITREYTEV